MQPALLRHVVSVPRGDVRSPQPQPALDAAFTLTYYDLPADKRHAYSRTQMVTALHVAHALEAVGLAQQRPVGPGEVTFGRISVKASRGVRYSVSPEAIDALGVGRGNPCIPVGRLALEILAVRGAGPGLAQVSARGKLSATPEWVLRLAEHLPALKLVLAEGVPVSGQLAYSAQGWRVAGLLPNYPEVQSHSVPPPLRRLLPQTEAAHPVVPAPAVLQ